MTPNAAILTSPATGWATTLISALSPGAHAIVVVSQELAGIEGRQAGLELRDTLLILSQGPRARFALLFRKPLTTTVAEQMFVVGTGGLHIKACRTHSGPSEGGAISGGSALGQGSGWNKHTNRTTQIDRAMSAGRWPPNVLLVHALGCRRIGTKKVLSDGHHPGQRGSAGIWSGDGGGLNGNEGSNRYMGGEHGLEEVASYECNEKCPVRLLDFQTGDRPSTLTGRADPHLLHANPGDNGGASLFGGGNSNVYADNGGASRFYPQFATEDELFEWMQRLIKPQ